MIKVNLLPAELAGKKRKERIAAPKPSFIVMVVVLALFVLVALEALLVHQAKASSDSNIQALTSELDDIQGKIDSLEDDDDVQGHACSPCHDVAAATQRPEEDGGEEAAHGAEAAHQRYS